MVRAATTRMALFCLLLNEAGHMAISGETGLRRRRVLGLPLAETEGRAEVWRGG